MPVEKVAHESNKIKRINVSRDGIMSDREVVPFRWIIAEEKAFNPLESSDIPKVDAVNIEIIWQLYYKYDHP
jgi:hypothetical protein